MRRVVIAVIGLVGLVLVGCGDDDSSSSGEPADLLVKAEGSLSFDKDAYTVSSGSATIELKNDDSQLHTLLIEDVGGFKLKVTGKGDSDRGTADLEPGTYTIYCDVPGHRSAGMEADLTVS